MEKIEVEQYKKFLSMDFFQKEDNFYRYKQVKSLREYGNYVDKPFISIMIPTYKRTTYLRYALESAFHQKTRFKYEIIVVDNTTENDDILNIVREYPESKVLYYRNEENLGMFGNWNRCIELSNANYFVLLHDDDLLSDNYIEEMGTMLEKNSNIGVIGCTHDIIDESGNVISNTNVNFKIGNIEPMDFYINQPIHIAGCLFNKKLAIECGGFSPDFFPMSDSVFIAKTCFDNKNRKTLKIDKILSHYRIGENESLNPSTMIGEVVYFWVFPKYLNSKYNFYSAWANRIHCLNFYNGAKTAVLDHWKMDIDFTSLDFVLGIPKINAIEILVFKILRKLRLL